MTASIWIFACVLLAEGDAPESATPDQEMPVLSDVVGQQWLTRIRAVLPEKSWSVQRDRDVFQIARTEEVEFINTINAPPVLEEETAEERREREKKSSFKETFRLRLKFAPKLSLNEYEERAAINDESERQVETLRKGLKGISHKFDHYDPSSREEADRLRRYNTAVARLPWCALPDLYCDEFSVYFDTGFLDTGIRPLDEEVREECDSVAERLLTLFGVYDPRIARRERLPRWHDSTESINRARGMVRILDRFAK